MKKSYSIDATKLFCLGHGFKVPNSTYVRVTGNFKRFRGFAAKFFSNISYMFMLLSAKVMPQNELAALPTQLVRPELLEVATAQQPDRSILPQRFNLSLAPSATNTNSQEQELMDRDMREMTQGNFGPRKGK